MQQAPGKNGPVTSVRYLMAVAPTPTADCIHPRLSGSAESCDRGDGAGSTKSQCQPRHAGRSVCCLGRRWSCIRFVGRGRYLRSVVVKLMKFVQQISRGNCLNSLNPNGECELLRIRGMRASHLPFPANLCLDLVLGQKIT